MAHPLVPKIEEISKSKPVVIFMKGTPQFPQCGFSARACHVLQAAGVNDIGSINVLEEDDLWTALEEFTQWPTVPQIFVHGKFVGGCDIITEMYESGELQTLLKQK